MSFDPEFMMMPTVYLLAAVAVVFFVWALLLRSKDAKDSYWKEIMGVAVFCLLGAITMPAVSAFAHKISFTARMGLIAAILVPMPSTFIIARNRLVKLGQRRVLRNGG